MDSDSAIRNHDPQEGLKPDEYLIPDIHDIEEFIDYDRVQEEKENEELAFESDSNNSETNLGQDVKKYRSKAITVKVH